MTAIVCTKCGSRKFLALREAKKTTPKNHEVLTIVRATTVTEAELAAVRGL